jgi:putative transposase
VTQTKANSSKPAKKQKTKRKIKCKSTLDMYTQKQRTIQDCIGDLRDPSLPTLATEEYRCMKITLRPTQKQKQRLRSFIGAYRYTYNEMLATYRDQEKCKSLFEGVENPPWQDVRAYVTHKDTSDPSKGWVTQTPHNVRELAGKEFANARKIACANQGKGNFAMQFKSLKRSKQQTIPIGQRAVRFTRDGVVIYVKSDPSIIRFKNLRKKDRQALFEKCASGRSLGREVWVPRQDLKLVYDRGSRAYSLHVPLPCTQKWVNRVSADGCAPENQGGACQPSQPRVIALDPGVRTFLTGYSPDGVITEFAPQSVQRLCRLSHWVDRMSAKISTMAKANIVRGVPVVPQKRIRARIKRLKRVRRRLFSRITHLVDEVHWKSAAYLCDNFDVIMLPEFGVSSMVRKRKNGRRRVISKNTTRRMLLWAHYRFRQRLIGKAKQHGRVLLICNEAYTTKTCGRCGAQNHTIGRAKTFWCPSCSSTCDRDANGARNIFLRNISAVVDLSTTA